MPRMAPSLSRRATASETLTARKQTSPERKIPFGAPFPETDLGQGFPDGLRLGLFNAHVMMGQGLRLGHKSLSGFGEALRQEFPDPLSRAVGIGHDDDPPFPVGCFDQGQGMGRQGESPGLDGLSIHCLLHRHGVHLAFYYQHFFQHDFLLSFTPRNTQSHPAGPRKWHRHNLP